MTVRDCVRGTNHLASLCLKNRLVCLSLLPLLTVGELGGLASVDLSNGAKKWRWKGNQLKTMISTTPSQMNVTSVLVEMKTYTHLTFYLILDEVEDDLPSESSHQ